MFEARAAPRTSKQSRRVWRRARLLLTGLNIPLPPVTMPQLISQSHRVNISIVYEYDLGGVQYYQIPPGWVEMQQIFIGNGILVHLFSLGWIPL